MKSTRRNLLKTSLRGVAAAAVAATAAVLGIRRLASPSNADHTCSGDFACGSCTRLSSCILPQAASRREAKRG